MNPKQRRYGPAELSVSISVEDHQLDENSGVFRGNISDGKAEVRFGAAGEDLRRSVAAVSSIIIGELAPSRVAAIGELQVRDPEILTQDPGPTTCSEPFDFQSIGSHLDCRSFGAASARKLLKKMLNRPRERPILCSGLLGHPSG